LDFKIGELKMEREISKKESFIRQILKREWEFFQNVHHTEGRAECQNNPQEFEIMRRSQWETLPDEILESYLEDLILAKHRGENIVQDKYARMMKYSVPKEYEIIKDYLPEISPAKEELVQKIVEIYLHWEEEIIQKYPKVTAKGRPLHSEFDTPNHTSIETYLKGELSSYSVKTLKLYYEYIQSCVTNNVNLAENNLENIVLEKGYKTIDEAEKSL